MNNKIIKRCKNGDKDAFNELIKFYYPFVLKFLMKLTCNKDIALDLVQETFIKIIEKIDHFKTSGKASFSTYLIKVSKNTYIDYLRKNHKEFQEIDMNIIPDKKTLESNYFKLEDYNLLIKNIDNLPLAQKEAIKLKYLEGYTLNEIAKMKNVESKTIKSRLFEARKKLKEYLKGTDIYE